MRALLAAALLGAAAASPAFGHAPATLVRLPEPRETTGPEGAPGLVLDLGRGATLVALAAAGDLDEARHEVRVGDAAVGGWTMPWGDGSRTLVGFRRGDDVVVGTRVATSVGMGVESWRVTAFRLRGAEALGAPVRFASMDWGPDAVRTGGAGLAVMATDWISPLHGRAKASLHFAGGWFEVSGGRLAARGAWVARPYLFSFERERLDGAGAQPVRWLRAGKAAPYAGGDARLGPASARVLSGTVAEGPTLAGRKLWFEDTEAPAGALAVDHVVDRGAVYPRYYVPGDAKAWGGRRAEVRRYDDRTVLHLQ